MPEEITLTLPISTLEELRCFLCQGYLSCSPVRLLPNGNCICGCCSPLNTEGPVYRFVAFEAVLSKMSFPCIFKKYGCTSTLLFGETAKHESKCVHKPVACPTNISTICSWEGIPLQLLQHFKKVHPDFVKNKAEFKLELDQDAQGIFMTTDNSFEFIVKYFYNSKERILKYDVRYCNNNNEFAVFSKLQLINGTDADCNTNLKMTECFSYDETFYNMQNAKVLNLYKFLESLSEPDSIVVALSHVIKSVSNIVTTTASDCEINFELIKTLKCSACQNYLVPPLFDLGGNTICCDCSKSNSRCKPSNDTDLLKLVNEAVYPCRWQECKFVGKSSIFKDHEMNCQFRLYCCAYSSCESTFKLSIAVDHLLTHTNMSTVYISGKITFKMSFAQSYSCKHILTMKDKRMVIIEHKIIQNQYPCVLHISLYQSSEASGKIMGTVDFQHEHCKLKSKEFNVFFANALKVTLKELPPCFKETDELTVTVELIVQ